jgi:hypothetical protein
MAPPQLITDFMRLMLLLAPSAAIICLVLAGLGLRQGSVPDALVGGNFAKWMFWAIVFLTLPQLISFQMDETVSSPRVAPTIGSTDLCDTKFQIAPITASPAAMGQSVPAR